MTLKWGIRTMASPRALRLKSSLTIGHARSAAWENRNFRRKRNPAEQVHPAMPGHFHLKFPIIRSISVRMNFCTGARESLLGTVWKYNAARKKCFSLSVSQNW